MSLVVNTSLWATGTPASGPSSSPAARRASTSRAWASALARPTCRKAPMSPSTASMRSRYAVVACSEVTSPAAMAAPSSAAVMLMTSLMGYSSSQDPRDPEALFLHRGGPGQGLFRGEAGSGLVGSVDVGQRQGVRAGRDVALGDFLHLGHGGEDVTELGGECVDLALVELQP